jgi:hypothetical protein
MDFTSRLVAEVSTVAANVPGSWFITHGLGTPAAGTYTEVAFAPEVLQQPEATEAALEQITRQVARALYGNAWAFTYRPDQWHEAIERHGMRRRERVVVTELSTW